SVGGAIGPLYATALMRVAAVVRLYESEPSGMSVTALLRECAEAAEASVAQSGGAKPGDKTVIDALHPAVESLRAADADGLDPRAAIARAADATRAGADATTDMVATVGRASRFGERSRGAPDPGAMSLAVILGAIAATFPAVPEGGVPRA
ncbi:MAG TPA: dihydroxyacetone kinase subunit L, partial [Candidatus Limnocylindrales bacterium]